MEKLGEEGVKCLRLLKYFDLDFDLQLELMFIDLMI